MCNKAKNKNKKYFCKCFHCFSSGNVLIEHKENWLIINGKLSVKLKSGSISFKNYFKQLPVSFKIYADFECIFKKVESSSKNNGSYTEKYQDHIPCSFAYKVVCANNNFSKKFVLCSGKNAAYRFTDFCKKMIKKHFNKNLIMSAEEEEKFQLSNSCWISGKLFDVGDEKCHIAGKCRSAAHRSCIINLKLTKKTPVMLHHLRDYDSHLIIKEISNFDVKVSVIPNGLEKYMAFTINTNLIFIDSMQFMNFSLNSLVKNLSDNGFKYLKC